MLTLLLWYAPQRSNGVLAPGEVLVVTCPHWNCRAYPDRLRYELGDNPAFFVDSPWADAVHDVQLWSAGEAPSTGFMAIAFAVAIAGQLNATVDVYGFGRCQECSKYYVSFPCAQLGLAADDNLAALTASTPPHNRLSGLPQLGRQWWCRGRW